MGNWQAIAAALRAYQQAQQQTWGTLDDMLIAKYLAGDCSAEEQQAVQRAMQEYPAVRELVEVVDKALALAPLPAEIIFSEGAATAPAEVGQQALTAAPLPAQPLRAEPAGPSPIRLVERIWRMAGNVATLTGPLAAWIDEHGQLACAGLHELLSGPPPVYALSMGSAHVLAAESAYGTPRPGQATWQIPLPEHEAELIVSLRPPSAAAQGSLSLQLTGPAKAELLQDARLEIVGDFGEKTPSGPLSLLLDDPIPLSAGAGEISLELGTRVLLIPLRLKPPESGAAQE